jgi:hypothetical protein
LEDDLGESGYYAPEGNKDEEYVGDVAFFATIERMLTVVVCDGYAKTFSSGNVLYVYLARYISYRYLPMVFYTDERLDIRNLLN